jgi:anti-sigma regulatory factor (Ser/Thr protein kinase)
MEITQKRVPVVERSQIITARNVVREMAETAGMTGEEDLYRAGLVATELASNLVKHTREGGELLIGVAGPRHEASLEVLSIDRGPGISDIATALRDGHSSAGSMGGGLGAVKRLSTTFDVYSRRGTSAGVGTVVLSRIAANKRRTAPDPFEIGGVSVAKAGEHLSGDAWTVMELPGAVTVVVADGLGHGAGAHEAATAMLSAVIERPADDCVTLLERAHAGMRHTRGAAAAVAHLRAGNGALMFAGVGNVSAVIARDSVQRHAVSLNGTLGHQAGQIREYQYPWERGALLVMHTDGLATRWALESYPGLREHHPSLVAGVLYRDYTRHRDDVTVVVVREAA